MSFNVGGVMGGSLAPFLAQALVIKGGLVWVGVYLSGAALISFLALRALRNKNSLL
jgi:hypothetical protein